MRVTYIDPPRTFPVGVREVIHLKDCARISLEPDEQVTFVTKSGAEYDVVRKSWGYYATPSLNARLPSYGLKPALVRSGDRLYLLLVEAAKEAEFLVYLQKQGMDVVSWLDQVPGSRFQVPDSSIQHSALSAQHDVPQSPISDSQSACRFCGSTAHTLIFTYDTPPVGETLFPLQLGEIYHREIWRCQGCGHFVNRHSLDLRRLYEGSYVDATYHGDKLFTTFQKIMALPPERSDNSQRVQRIVRYMKDNVRASRRDREEQEERSLAPFAVLPPTLLDVGAGLCVFPARMKAEGWKCTALDPDPRAIEHAQRCVEVQGICGDFLTAPQLGLYDLITFNKVLEHVEDPVLLLQKSRQHLRPNGVVYIELPDGEAAATAGPGREEFFIEHYHVFSMASLSILATQAGFTVHCVERVREPSSKYTLRAFLHPTTEH